MPAVQIYCPCMTGRMRRQLSMLPQLLPFEAFWGVAVAHLQASPHLLCLVLLGLSSSVSVGRWQWQNTYVSFLQPTSMQTHRHAASHGYTTGVRGRRGIVPTVCISKPKHTCLGLCSELIVHLRPCNLVADAGGLLPNAGTPCSHFSCADISGSQHAQGRASMHMQQHFTHTS